MRSIGFSMRQGQEWKKWLLEQVEGIQNFKFKS